MAIRTTEVCTILCLIVVAIAAPDSKKNNEEAIVSVEFLEFELEDICSKRNQALWNFYTGKNKNLNELINEEANHRKAILNEINNKHFKDPEFNKSSHRLFDILFSTGTPNLDDQVFSDVTGYAAGVQQANVYPGGSATVQQIQNALLTSSDPKTLKGIWTAWIKKVGNASDDLTRQISYLGLEAEANGADDVEKYWLSKSELTKLDYKGAAALWEKVAPLYKKLSKFLLAAADQKFGASLFKDKTLLPVHLLGSLDSSDWVTAAEKFGALTKSATFTALTKELKSKSISDLYAAADETSSELKLGHLPQDFFKQSDFNNTAESCLHLVENTCKEETLTKVLHCKTDPASVANFLKASEEITHIKHNNIAGKEKKNSDIHGYFLREGPRDSVLYEAIAAASTLIAVNPINLERRGLIKEKPSDAKITSHLLIALRLLPPMPLHLSYDLWRLQAVRALSPEEETPTTPAITTIKEDEVSESETQANLTEAADVEGEGDKLKENLIEDDGDSEDEEEEVKTEEDEERSTTKVEEETTGTVPNEVSSIATEPPILYDRVNLTADWWAVRGKHQLIGPPDGDLVEDYLLDNLVIWNKPHISKFLGPILLFQILEKFSLENTTDNLSLLWELLHKGKSQPWEVIVADMFNITELNPQPLLDYFKPLEEFLDNGAQFGFNLTALIGNDLKLFLQTTSLGFPNIEQEVPKSASGENSHAIMIILVGLAIIGATGAVVSIVRKRMQKRQLAKKRRKFDEMEYQ